jgi:hypothetical protein
MPAYIVNPQFVQLVQLNPGNSIAVVNNAAVDSGILTTQQLAIGPDPTGNSQVTVTNTTNQTATPQTASTDTAAQYEPYYVQGSAITVPAGESVSSPINARWLRFTYATAPTSGSLIVTR